MISAGPLPLPAADEKRPRPRTPEPLGAARRKARASHRTRASSTGVALFSAFVLILVASGWLLRDRIPLTPESGVGHALGFAGGGTMLLLSLYSVRKRVRFMRHWGPLSQWFRIHMFLGVLGPLLILFHCNFRLGAPNSNVALVSMLVVAGSGVVGRYIYTRISHGLYGARATFGEFHAQLDANAHTLDERLPRTSRAAQRLAAFTARARAPRRTIGGRLLWLLALPLAAMRVRRGALHDLRSDLDDEAVRRGWDGTQRRTNEAATREVIGAYIAALVKEVQFSAFERLFSLWHALHVPLFVMLLLTGVMHVIAVHMY